MPRQLSETSTTLEDLYEIVLLNSRLLIGQLASKETELTPDSNWRIETDITSTLILGLMRFL